MSPLIPGWNASKQFTFPANIKVSYLAAKKFRLPTGALVKKTEIRELVFSSTAFNIQWSLTFFNLIKAVGREGIIQAHNRSCCLNMLSICSPTEELLGWHSSHNCKQKPLQRNYKEVQYWISVLTWVLTYFNTKMTIGMVFTAGALRCHPRHEKSYLWCQGNVRMEIVLYYVI